MRGINDGRGSQPDKNAVARFLFHLGKGLWKSVPVIGPVVEELFYVQYETQLLDQVDRLSEADLRRIVEALPKVSEVKLAEEIDRLSTEQKILSLGQFGRVLEDIHGERREILDGISDVRESLQMLPSIVEMIREVRLRVADRASTESLLADYEQRRHVWLARMSRNQRALLDSLPTTFLALASIWKGALALIPSCGYKEFRFRLHELEWLGLVERRMGESGEWEYRRGHDREGSLG